MLNKTKNTIMLRLIRISYYKNRNNKKINNK